MKKYYTSNASVIIELFTLVATDGSGGKFFTVDIDLVKTKTLVKKTDIV
ncbi:hypothetical protein [Brachyspira aalborgi]|nr:hypothetical protein [Brachyspira aalborgi]